MCDEQSFRESKHRDGTQINSLCYTCAEPEAPWSAPLISGFDTVPVLLLILKFLPHGLCSCGVDSFVDNILLLTAWLGEGWILQKLQSPISDDIGQ